MDLGPMYDMEISFLSHAELNVDVISIYQNKQTNKTHTYTHIHKKNPTF